MMARSYVWWPMIDRDIENFIRNCLSCQQSQNVIRKPTTTSWPKTDFPFQRIHKDFFQFSAKNGLIISDDHTKYCEAKIMSSTNAESVIDRLTNFFCVFGLASELVSDNGSPFQSKKFADFLKSHRIKFIPAPAYHPQSNGQAERSVRTIKQCLIKFVLYLERNATLKEKIQKFVIYHNNSPSAATGKSPSSYIFSYKPKTLLNLINFRVRDAIDSSAGVNELRNSVKDNVVFEVGQNVMYLNHFKSHVNWIPAKIVQRVSMLTYLISVYGSIRLVHERQLRCSKLEDIHHDPPNKVLLRNAGSSVLKIEIPVENKVKFKEVVDKRSVSVADGRIVQRPQRTIVKPKT